MLKTPKLRHIRSDGEIATDFSSYCPLCAFHLVSKEVLPDRDFDENGWYQVVKYVCQDTKCNHAWSEKVYITEAGQSHFYGKGLK